MSEFKRKKGESFESFLRRFSKAMIQSRKLNEVRGRKYYKRTKNKAHIKKMALKGKQIQEKNEYMKKIGKLKETVRGKW